MDTLTSVESQLHISNSEEHSQQRYTRIKLLGQGTYGKAFLVQSKDNHKKYVCKEITLVDMNKIESDKAFREALILSELSHPNIIKFQQVYRTENQKLKIIMQYADGGDIASKMKQYKQQGKVFTESQVLSWFTQICLAIKHCHDRKIIHRDIKGQNVFLMANGMAKLGDFGISTILTKTLEKANTIVGTPYYLSPEIIENKPYSFKSDVWSLGVLLYEMCAFKTPFTGNSLHFLALKIVKGSYPSLPSTFSYQIRSLIKSMLHTDPIRRPTVHQILKTKLISGRIKDFLSESQRHTQFSHTILHNKHIPQNKLKNLINNEQPFNPLLIKQTDSEVQQKQQKNTKQQEIIIMQNEIQEQEEKVKQNRIRKDSNQSKNVEREEDCQSRRSSIVDQNVSNVQQKIDLQPSSRKLFPNIQQNQIKSPQVISKQTQGKIYKHPTTSGSKQISSQKPNLQGLLDIKANPIVAHPVREAIKVFTPQVFKKQPASKQKQIQMARKTQDFAFKRKLPDLQPPLKRNNSRDKLDTFKKVQQKRPLSKKLIKQVKSSLVNNPVSINSKKQIVTISKQKKNSSREIKQSKKDSKQLIKVDKLKIQQKQKQKKPPIPKSTKGLEIKSQQIKKQEAIQKQKNRKKLIDKKSKQKDRKNTLSKQKQKIQQNKKQQQQNEIVQQINNQSSQTQIQNYSTEQQQKYTELQSQFEQQKYDVSESRIQNQTYSFPQDYYNESFQQQPSQISELRQSNLSQLRQEQQKMLQNLEQTPSTQFNQMLNQMIQIMNSDTIVNSSSITEQPSLQQAQETQQIVLPSNFIDNNQSIFGGDLTYTNTITALAGLQCFQDMSKLQDLRYKFQQDFGFQKFIEIYRMIQKQVQNNGLQFDDKELFKQILSIGVDQNMLIKHFSYLITLVILENPLVSQQ